MDLIIALFVVYELKMRLNIVFGFIVKAKNIQIYFKKIIFVFHSLIESNGVQYFINCNEQVDWFFFYFQSHLDVKIFVLYTLNLIN